MRKTLTLLALALLAAPAAAQPYQTGRVPPTPAEYQAMQVNAAPRHAELTANWQPATEAKWDSREHGWVPPVKNQKNCGSCWDFSGTGVVEIALCKAGKYKAADLDLSEQYTLSCYENGGCNGDDNTTVLKHAKRVGLPFTKDYGPYAASEGRCKDSGKLAKVTVDDWAFADGDVGYERVGNVQKIKDAIKNTGCVGCAIAADNAFSNVRPGQVFHGTSRSINHDIILVGWDDSKGAWLLRNSWGTNWCDGGYCLIAYGANSVGTEPVYAVMNVPDPAPPGPVPHDVRGKIGLGLAGLLLVAVLVVMVVLIRRHRQTPPMD